MKTPCEYYRCPHCGSDLHFETVCPKRAKVQEVESSEFLPRTEVSRHGEEGR